LYALFLPARFLSTQPSLGCKRLLRGGLLFSILCFWLVLHSSAALAHDTWLLPRAFFLVQGKDRIVLDLTSGMAFPTLDHAIRPERVKQSAMQSGGKTLALVNLSPEAKSLVISGASAASGIGTCFVELHPKSLVLKPASIMEYLKEIGASDSLKAFWRKASKTMPWRETYTKHAKTFVAFGTDEAQARTQALRDSSWAQPVGLTLELVPEDNPFSRVRGDTITVRLLKNGRPLAGCSVGAVCERRSAPATMKRTDAQGRVSFVLKASGRWLIRCTELRPSQQPDMDFESDFTTATFFVAEPIVKSAPSKSVRQ
jgi:uncharacterized GH25 family protein